MRFLFPFLLSPKRKRTKTGMNIHTTEIQPALPTFMLLWSTSISRVFSHPFFFDVCRTVPYFYVLQTRVVLGLGKDSELFSSTPWRPATIDNLSACGIVIPSRVRGRLQHTMGNVGCAWFGWILSGGRVVRTLLPNAIMSFLCVHVMLNVSIYLTLY